MSKISVAGIDGCPGGWVVVARIAEGRAISFPDPPERDAHDLPIAIWT